MSRANESDQFHQISHNTVVKEKSITIHYPHHPYYGKSFPILEIHRNGNPPGYVCRISKTVTLFIPEWVTYAESGEGSAIEKSPQISFPNLLRVAGYLKDPDLN
jgi:hypothetical protein